LTVRCKEGKHLGLLNNSTISVRNLEMVSKTAVTESKRKNKKSKTGKKRKAKNRNKGTTPKFSIHEEK